jgi:hypothetical protein
VPLAPETIARPGPLAVPYTYTLGATEYLQVMAAFASWDGSGASGAFLPALSFYDGAGNRFMRVFPTTSIAQGGTADVTYAPFPGGLIKSGQSGTLPTTIFLTAAGLWPALTAGSSFPNRVASATNAQNVYLVDFPTGSQLFAHAMLVMPSNWDAGTITAQFVWMVNGTTTGNVTWRLQGCCYGSGSTLDQAYGTAQTVSSAATGTANQVIVSSATPAITLGGSPAASQFTQLRLARNGNADSLAATARLLGVLVTYGTV